MRAVLLAVVAALACEASARADVTSTEAARLAKAARVVREINQTISADLWTRARCVAVVPDVKKAALVIGGEYGKGVLSCRAGDGWSAPVFLQLAKGSWGFQAGAEQIDLVLFVMNESGVQKLLRDKVSLGADASVAAGPVGRQGHVGTDAQLTAEILSYSRAQGLFAGIDLSGGVLRPDEDANRDVYGRNASPRVLLASRSLSAPTAATAFLDALAAQPVAVEAARGRAPAEARPAAGTPRSPGTGPGSEELRARIAEMRATLDRILDSASPVGTTGTSGSTGVVSVDRAQLLKLREQLDAIATSLQK